MITFLAALWALKSIGSILRTTYFWQLKEYRWDRMRAFFLTQGGVKSFFTISDALTLVVLLIAAALFVFAPEHALLTEGLPIAIAVLLLSEVLEIVHQLVQRRLKRPRLTTKALLILVSTFALEALLIFAFVYYTWQSISILSFSVLIALLVLFEHDINAAVVFFFNGITQRLKRRTYKQAASKRSSMPDLKVVGITGSYGKTSVKEFLSHILEGQFKVLKTAKNTNTEIGIAKTIVNDLKTDHEIFVCEMGAYKVGEIRICSMMAQPQTALFTGLNEQHIALFGSLDNTFSAKWELPSSLPADGLLVANGDAPELKKRLRPHRGKTKVCSLTEGDVTVDQLMVYEDHFAFQYNDQSFEAPLVGGFQAINVLMAIVAAEHLGMPLEAIAERVKSLSSPDKTLELFRYGDIAVCDDSYNVNSDGLKAAVEHLQHFGDVPKILFFPGILELGEQSQRIHKELGEFLSHHVDHVFFFDLAFSSELAAGALQGGLSRAHIHLATQSAEQIEQLKTLLEAHDHKAVVLFESRGAESVLEWIQKTYQKP